jgi:hypothetical protein
MYNSKDLIIKKINEDDILEILIEKFYETDCSDFPSAKGVLLGEVGENLRFIGIFTNEDNWKLLREIDVNKIDSDYDYNGDHFTILKNPDLHVKE